MAKDPSEGNKDPNEGKHGKEDPSRADGKVPDGTKRGMTYRAGLPV